MNRLLQYLFVFLALGSVAYLLIGEVVALNRAKDAGAQFGRYRTIEDCIYTVTAGRNTCLETRCILQNRYFLTACLEQARFSQTYCTQIPNMTNRLDAEGWATNQCDKFKRKDRSCFDIHRRVLDICGTKSSNEE